MSRKCGNERGEDIPAEFEKSDTGAKYYITPNDGPKSINRAIQDGATIFLTEGTYTLNKTILADANNLTIRGAGMFSTELKVADGAEIKPIEIGTDGTNYENITISNLTIDGNEADQSDTALRLHGIDAHRGRHLRFENLYIKDTFPHVYNEGINDGTNTGGNGILCRRQTEDVLIDNLLGWHCGYDTVSLTGTQMQVTNSWSFRQGNRGFSGDYRDENNVADGFYVSNCISESGTYPASAFGMRGSVSGSDRGTEFVLDNCRAFMRDGATGRRAISLRSVDDFTISNFTANGNNLTGSPLIILGCSDGNISGVHIYNSPNHGIELDSNCKNISINAAHIQQPSSTGILAQGNHIMIGGGTNIYKPGNTGIDIQASNSTVGLTTITDAGSHGISVSSDDNIIYSNQIQGSSYSGVKVNGIENIIALNRVSGSGKRNIDNGGTSTESLGNVTGERNNTDTIQDKILDIVKTKLL